MTRLPQAACSAAIVILCSLLLLLISSCGHRSATPRAHSADLKWKASASRVVGYNVYRSDKSQGPYTKLNSAVVPTTSYTDMTVQAGHTYFYLVTAVDAQGHESAFSNQIKAVVPSR